MKSRWLLFYAALYLSTLLNLALWRFVAERISISSIFDLFFLFSIFLLVFFVNLNFVNLIIWPKITKILLALLFMASASANYAMFQLGIYIDSDMIRNILETNQREAFDLVTLKAVIWFLIFGVIPSVGLIIIKIDYKKTTIEIVQKIIILIASLAIGASVFGFFYKEYASFGRNNKQIIRLVSPLNYFYSFGRYFYKKSLANKVFQIVDPNAVHTPYKDEHATVLVLVVGETARSMNFSLNGYAKLTNPKLAQQDVVSFKNVSSCGTATAISLPCLFSNLPRQKFKVDDAVFNENLLDILQKSGYDILWRENDDGCKGVCNRVPTDDMVKLNNKKYCDGTVCFDGALLDGLEDYISKITKDTVIVLHTIGSHGPTYYKRYPDEFKIFEPTCDTAEISSCSQNAIENTYDNTVVYTDYILSETIDILKKFPNFESGLIYISDHGESLGENNIYLHGLPYSIAPKEQTSVPMIVWLSKTMKSEDFIDYACLKNKADTEKISHDYFFHSILGLMEIKSELYEESYDFFQPCRTQNLPWISANILNFV